MQKIYYIPQKTEYVIVADLFTREYSGGAELTLEAILKKCPGKYFQLNSRDMTSDLVQKNKDKYWILGNFAHADRDALAELVRTEVKFSIVECDYKYCKYRSSHLHIINERQACRCSEEKHGLFVRQLFSKAEKVMFMSAAQRDEYVNLFPTFNNDNFLILSSVFDDATLSMLSQLCKDREKTTIEEKYAILSGGSWIKAEKETIEWCQQNNINFDLVGNLSYQTFLKKISSYKGLVFRPAGFDTCPRLVIEAKMLGLELLLNDNVQMRKENWFKSDINTCQQYLLGRADFFWSNVNV